MITSTMHFDQQYVRVIPQLILAIGILADTLM